MAGVLIAGVETACLFFRCLDHLKEAQSQEGKDHNRQRPFITDGGLVGGCGLGVAKRGFPPRNPIVDTPT